MSHDLLSQQEIVVDEGPEEEPLWAEAGTYVQLKHISIISCNCQPQHGLNFPLLLEKNQFYKSK